MRSLAVKIFLSFWIAQVVILVGLEVMRPRSNVYPPPLPRPSPVFIPTPVLIAAVVVSAVVCFLLARHLASPLKRVREASGRLAAGDLGARAGDMLRPRRDEIGDVVRDFDAMAERLHLLVSTQKQLLSDISHELRSPLARLHVAVELARRKAGPDAENHLNRIEAEGTRMNEMIGQLLTLARADSDRPAITEEVDLSDIVRSVATDTDYEARQTGREVRVLRSDQAIVLGDAALLASAVENVVRNASRYTRAGSAVDISLEATPTHGRICVRDHGPGVPPDETERIFLPFHRVGASRDRNSGGTGLGLSIAARAVKAHGGSIRAANAEGGGLEVFDRHSALQSFTPPFSFLTARAVHRAYSGSVGSSSGGKRNARQRKNACLAEAQREGGNWTPRSARPYWSDRRGTGCRVLERYADEPDRRIRSGDDDDNHNHNDDDWRSRIGRGMRRNPHRNRRALPVSHRFCSAATSAKVRAAHGWTSRSPS